MNLKFKADESTLPRTVTGKIKYNDGDFSNEKEFTIFLKDLNILDDLKVIKKMREINGLDVSDPLWTTTDAEEAISYKGKIVFKPNY